MKIALPFWQGRISPVLDEAGQLLLVEIAEDAELTRREVALKAHDPQRRAAELAGSGADVLVCGAISYPLRRAVESAGIDVIAQICGDIEQVLTAFLRDQLQSDVFLMPGCCRRGGGERDRRRRRGRSPGLCRCRQCGQSVPHTPGRPCNRHTCPRCGATMIRG